MHRITRYVLAEFLQVFCLALLGMSATMLLVVVASMAISEGLGLSSVLKLLPYSVPIALLYAIPGTTLFAVCSIYGRMSASNEIVAIKAAGISPLTLVSPILVLSFVMSIAVVWLNDIAVSWGRAGVNRVMLESVEQIAYGMLRTKKSYSTKRFSINVRSVEGQKLIKPTVTLRLNDNGPAMVCIAEEAELRSNPARETLEIVLRDCEIDSNGYHAEFPGEMAQEIPLSAATRRGYDPNRPSDTALGKIPQQISEQKREIEQLEQAFAVEASLQMMTGDLEGLTSADWVNRHNQMRDAIFHLRRLHTEPWRRAANGFSCFCFALVGAPLAIRLRNADVWTSFGICFLPILAVYYPLMMYGVGLAKSGEMPPHCVWLGNLVLAVIGYWLIRKVLRY